MVTSRDKKNTQKKICPFDIIFKRLGKRIVLLVEMSVFVFATCIGFLQSRKTMMSRSDCWFSNQRPYVAGKTNSGIIVPSA